MIPYKTYIFYTMDTQWIDRTTVLHTVLKYIATSIIVDTVGPTYFNSVRIFTLLLNHYCMTNIDTVSRHHDPRFSVFCSQEGPLTPPTLRCQPARVCGPRVRGPAPLQWVRPGPEGCYHGPVAVRVQFILSQGAT